MSRLHSIAALGLGLSACAGAPVQVDPARTPEQQMERLLTEGLNQALEQVQAQYELLPFALVLHRDGSTEKLGGGSTDPLDTTNSQVSMAPDPAKLLAGLEQRVAREAKDRGDVTAVGFFSDTEVKLPSGQEKGAVRAGIEHASGACEEVFAPIGRVGNDVVYDARITEKRRGVVFTCK